MKKMANFKVTFLLCMTMIFGLASSVCAGPITLSLTIDEPTIGRAVLSGSLGETKFDVLTFDHIQSVTGTNWFVETRVLTSDEIGFNGFSLFVKARHLHDPHSGEAAQGLLLKTTKPI